LEETRVIDGELLTIRPAKAVDQRRIQEHYYALDRKDVVSRFFHEKTAFLKNEIEGVSIVDYIKDLTLVALVGEIGFQRVVAVGVYLFEEANNIAEIAFSVSKDWQGRGLGRILLNKLVGAAIENGIRGLVAFTTPTNTGMVRLFGSLPYKVRSTQEADLLTLTCNFSVPK
jgi:GNAT superfamily N-acetyltransferase